MASILTRLPDEIHTRLSDLCGMNEVTLQSLVETFLIDVVLYNGAGNPQIPELKYLDRVMEYAKSLSDRKKREGIAKGLQTQQERNDDYRRNF